MMMMMFILYLLETKGETENVGVCTKERKGVAAEVLMATPSLSHVRETMGFTGYSEMYYEGRGQMMREGGFY